MKIAALGVSVMIAGSIIVGISNSKKSSTAPVWRTETSNACERDKLVVTEMILHIAAASCVTGHIGALFFPQGPSHGVIHLRSN
jgi:hypothetical protein